MVFVKRIMSLPNDVTVTWVSSRAIFSLICWIDLYKANILFLKFLLFESDDQHMLLFLNDYLILFGTLLFIISSQALSVIYLL